MPQTDPPDGAIDERFPYPVWSEDDESVESASALEAATAPDPTLVQLPPSDDYVRLFEPRNLHWGQASTVALITALGQAFRPQGYRVEVGNITGPNRKNRYSRTHQGGPFDLAYPFADGASGAKDHAGASSSPYRLPANATPAQAAAVDYARLFELLTWLVARQPVWQVLIGHHVMAALRDHCARNHARVPRSLRTDGAWVIVAGFDGHDDHIHVSIRSRR